MPQLPDRAWSWLGRIAGAAVVLALLAWPRSAASPASGHVLSDCDGGIRELVLHWTPEAAAVAVPAWRELLAGLPASVRVHVACPDQAAFADLVARLGPVPQRLVAHPLGHPLTCWSRDRWLPLALPDDRVELFLPDGEDGAEHWPGRAGDGRAGDELASRLPGLVARRAGWRFDGGDVVADATTAFVSDRMVRRNLGDRSASPAALSGRLAALIGKRVVLLSGGPDHHVCMVMMVAGSGRVLVGDPSLAARILGEHADLSPGGDDFSPQAQARFDAVAAACAKGGYAVTRIPIIPARDSRRFISWTNAVLDERDGKRIAYVPSFSQVPTALQDAAFAAWRSLGWEVRPVECSATIAYGGAVRCLTNVLRR